MRCSDLSPGLLESRGSGESRKAGLARSAGRSVRVMALGRAWAAHGTEVGSLVSMASTKSYPPASGERVDLGLVQCAPTIGLFELPAFLLEVRIATKVFPGEAGRVERPKFLVRARVPPVGVAHRCRLHCHVAVQSACGDDRSEGGGSVRPGGATRVAVAARDAIAPSPTFATGPRFGKFRGCRAPVSL
jgi:hypothetical protein